MDEATEATSIPCIKAHSHLIASLSDYVLCFSLSLERR